MTCDVKCRSTCYASQEQDEEEQQQEKDTEDDREEVEIDDLDMKQNLSN